MRQPDGSSLYGFVVISSSISATSTVDKEAKISLMLPDRSGRLLATQTINQFVQGSYTIKLCHPWQKDPSQRLLGYRVQPQAKKTLDRHQHAKSSSTYGAAGQGCDPSSWWHTQPGWSPGTTEIFVIGMSLLRKSQHGRVALQQLLVAGH